MLCVSVYQYFLNNYRQNAKNPHYLLPFRIENMKWFSHIFKKLDRQTYPFIDGLYYLFIVLFIVLLFVLSSLFFD